jgi:hypothetical protein
MMKDLQEPSEPGEPDGLEKHQEGNRPNSLWTRDPERNIQHYAASTLMRTLLRSCRRKGCRPLECTSSYGKPYDKIEELCIRSPHVRTNIAAEFAPSEKSTLPFMDAEQSREQPPWSRPEERLSMNREASPGLMFFGHTREWSQKPWDLTEKTTVKDPASIPVPASPPFGGMPRVHPMKDSRTLSKSRTANL